MKYWKTEIVENWLYINSPIMENDLPFSVRRKLVEELRKIENKIRPLRGWIGYTKLKHAHIMIMYLKFGAIPYKIEKGNIWMKKEIL